MYKNILLKKTLVIGIFIFLFGVVITPVVCSVENSKFLEINEVTIQKDNLIFSSEIFNPTDDVYIKHNKPTTTCNIEYMSIRNEYGISGSPGWAWDGLIKFDISSIPSGTIIISATLNMYYWSYQDTNPAGRPLNLYRPLSDWDENTVTWNTQPSYASQPTTSSVVPGNYGWMTWDVTGDVQDFINGEKTNYGWKITDENYWGMTYLPTTRFRTKEVPSFESLVPYLEIEINEAPSAPVITGPTGGKPGTGYDYTFIPFDPEDQEMTLWIEWGDDSVLEWFGPYESGEIVTIPHTWAKQGTYVINAKAKDIYDAESDWGTLTVTIPREKFLKNDFLYRYLEIFPILQKFFIF